MPVPAIRFDALTRIFAWSVSFGKCLIDSDFQSCSKNATALGAKENQNSFGGGEVNRLYSGLAKWANGNIGFAYLSHTSS